MWVWVFLPLFVLVGLKISSRPLAVQQGFLAAGQALRQAEPRPERALSAALQLESAAERLPWRADLWEPAGRLALQGEDPQAALRLLERAAREGSLSTAGQIALGGAYQQVGDLSSAIRTWEALLQAEHPPQDVLAFLLEAYRAAGDYPAVVRTLQALAGLHPADAGLRYQLGLWTATQDPLSALAHLVQAAEMDEKYRSSAQVLIADIRTASLMDEPAFTLLGAGRALASLEEWELAEQAFRRAVLLRPDYAEAWAFWGEARQHLDPQDPQAIAALEKALDLDSDSLSVYMLIALHWQRQGRNDQALEYLQEAARRFPNQPALQVELGNVLALQGDLEGGLKAYQRAVELAPREAAYLRMLAEFSIRYEYRPEEVALPAARRAIVLDPADPASFDVMGQVLLFLNDLAGAERFFLRALEQDDDYALGHLHLGMLKILQGQPARAYDEWRRVVSLVPGSPVAVHAQRLINIYFP